MTDASQHCCFECHSGYSTQQLVYCPSFFLKKAKENVKPWVLWQSQFDFREIFWLWYCSSTRSLPFQVPLYFWSTLLKSIYGIIYIFSQFNILKTISECLNKIHKGLRIAIRWPVISISYFGGAQSNELVPMKIKVELGHVTTTPAILHVAFVSDEQEIWEYFFSCQWRLLKTLSREGSVHPASSCADNWHLQEATAG